MDIVVTWPKSRSLQSYLDELQKAQKTGKHILFRVGRMPRRVRAGDRCYMVHTGYVRGWVRVTDLHFPQEGQPPINPITGERMREGAYIVRSPIWRFLQEQPPVSGFQGVRYADPAWEHISSVRSFETQIEEP